MSRLRGGCLVSPRKQEKVVLLQEDRQLVLAVALKDRHSVAVFVAKSMNSRRSGRGQEFFAARDAGIGSGDSCETHLMLIGGAVSSTRVPVEGREVGDLPLRHGWISPAL